MWAPILAFFNPSNWMKILSLLLGIKDGIVAVHNWYVQRKIEQAQKEILEKQKKAEEKISEANKIEDEKERLKKKAEAANDLENSLINKP